METLFTYDELIPFFREVDQINRAAGISGISTDSRKDCSNMMFVPLAGETFDGHDFVEMAVDNHAASIVVSSKHRDLVAKFAAIPVFVVEDTLAFYQEIAHFHRTRLKGIRIVGVTGSSGKTSCKEILKSIFQHVYGADNVYATQGNTNNHVGVPLNLLNLRPNHRVAIIEMGSNHPGEIRVLTDMAQPDAAMISSIGASHLEFFGDTFGVAKEKVTIFSGLKKNGIAVLPADSEHIDFLRRMCVDYSLSTFGQGNDADFQAEYLQGTLNGSRFNLLNNIDNSCRTLEWGLQGRHQVINAAGCALTAYKMGIHIDAIADGLKTSRIPGMRMNVETLDGITWINDAYNANPDSMKAGLEWLAEFADPARTVLILGDMLELGESAIGAHKQTIEYAVSLFRGATLFLIGPTMGDAVAQLGKRDGLKHFLQAQDAVNMVNESLADGCSVFLKGSRGMKLETILSQLKA